MRKSGFTLAELLIALAILGVIATFTIPKVLSAQQSDQYKASAKEAASMFSGAYEAYKQQNAITMTMTATQLTPYMNYVALNTTPVDTDPYWATTFSCIAPWVCLKLHNGGTIVVRDDINFGGTASTNMIWMEFDPDSKVSSIKSVHFFMMYGGRLSSLGQDNGTVCNSGLCVPSGSGADPPWFNWN